MTFQRIWGRLSPIAWLFPLAIMAAGAFYEPLRNPISFGVPSIAVTPGLLVQLLLSLAWMLAEFRFAASRETTIKQLQSDALRSILLSLLLTFGAGWLLSLGACPWFYVIPTVTAILDAFLTANQGLNNAAQKPFVPHLKA